MVERIRSGQYEIGRVDGKSHRDPERTIGVVKGEAANDMRGGGFGRIIGLSKSKWYVYEQEEHLREYADRSGTGVLDTVSLEEEFSSKGDAVEWAESRYRV